MVEELSDSTLGERHLDLRRPRSSRQRSFPQAMRMMSDGHGTQIRAYVSEFDMSTPRLRSVTTHIAHPRAQSASPLLPRADGRREGPSEVTSSHSVRAERRGGGLLGHTSFLRTHTRPTVAREPSPEVYRAVREARKTLLYCAGGRAGKGLIAWYHAYSPMTSHPCGIIRLA